MPNLEPTEYHPLPGDPWRASEHNALVDQSAALDEVVRHEHGTAGDHADIRFAAAGGVAQWTGTTWSLLRSEGIASISGPAGRPTIVLEREMHTAVEWGVIGNTSSGAPIDFIQAGKTRDTCTIRVPGTLFFFLVVGPRAPL